MISCIIIDDEQHIIDLIKGYVEQIPFLKFENSFTSPIEALDFMNKVNVDLVFLDVHMEPFSGLDFIEVNQSRAGIIMITAYDDYAMKGYENDVIDYLLKPVSLSRFMKAAQKALNIITSKMIEQKSFANVENHIFVKTEQKGKFIKINYKDIEYIEGLKNYVSIYHQNIRTIALLNIRDLETRLADAGFIRVHKSYIVSIDKVNYIDGNQLKLINNDKYIPVGESYRVNLFEKLQLGLLGKKK
ncbi:hypothetical protein TH53_04385 [Pedobacter lusitanus]|uniref:LytTR family two component transcriptional regulator n=1 Tax=Pedobacter lusitanus TaxID=1503925 RepID=A0A0D0GQ16_9SPHI|nr:LytTR family DNA-binding domain-containing protein [Pedobacter lusitanus]KIO78260.1 hypothetical protein TH53_04385 [Pedobacter lusitanus]